MRRPIDLSGERERERVKEEREEAEERSSLRAVRVKITLELKVKSSCILTKYNTAYIAVNRKTQRGEEREKRQESAQR